MNRTLIALPVLLSAGLAAATAAAGGFTGPDAIQSATVADARNLPDDAEVRLSGYLIKSVGAERYQFQDDSGSITVEIDDDDWNGVEAAPDTRVELTGEIDSEGNEVEFDVDRVAIAQ